MPEQTAVVMAAATRNRWHVRGWFYISAALFMMVLNVAGFAPSIIDQSMRNAPLTPLVTAYIYLSVLVRRHDKKLLAID